VSTADVDAYLETVEDPAFRAALEALRTEILQVVPDAEEVISYGMPAFKVGTKVVAGFAAFTRHLSYFPHSGTVIAGVGAEAEPWATTKGTLQFTPDHPLPASLVARLVAVRLAELGG
jgi:uncharacterized protein YdhG (YjbR/CyaY superfamily)